MNKKLLNVDQVLRNTESGAVLPFFALILVILLGLAAFAVDFGFCRHASSSAPGRC
jgi:Flp pilus assembly protein TadG